MQILVCSRNKVKVDGRIIIIRLVVVTTWRFPTKVFDILQFFSSFASHFSAAMDGPAVSDSTQIKIDRSLSGDFGGSRRVINVGSWGRTSSVSLSRDGSGRILFEVVPDQCLAQVGDAGRPIDNDHEGAGACDETASSGNSFEISRRDSFPKYSSSKQRDSWKYIVDENSVFDDQVGERDVGIASPLPTDSILGAGDSSLSSSVLPLSHASSMKVSFFYVGSDLIRPDQDICFS